MEQGCEWQQPRWRISSQSQLSLSQRQSDSPPPHLAAASYNWIYDSKEIVEKE